MNNYLQEFEKSGYIIKKSFLQSKLFDLLCLNLNSEIDKQCSKINLNSLGGSYIGNLNVYAGKYGKEILNLLIKNGLIKIFEQITLSKISNYQILLGGNLTLCNKYNQHFHTDGSFKDKMILVSIATSNITEFNGPTEVVLNSHKKQLPYWKFLFKKKKTKRILLSKGDLIIRKHNIWHRGTINTSNKKRFLIAFLFFEKKRNMKANMNSNSVKIYNNFFGNSLLDRAKEILYVHFKWVYILYKAVLSFK